MSRHRSRVLVLLALIIDIKRYENISKLVTALERTFESQPETKTNAQKAGESVGGGKSREEQARKAECSKNHPRQHQESGRVVRRRHCKYVL